ncbi:Protein polybromo-1 [Chionoecetes opilio]|uniref:Protein polybromo-1 n=1 Tax=Chionoecetes opilio TaxID=41210 RepID=A0A8J4Y1A3_CHIOP|nr:Protein polybromo-1 [Chionoecetes opilio]
MIKSPIDMLKIQQKIKTDVYNELEEFCKDVQLLVDNAKLYYAKSTDENKDACELWEIFLAAKERAPDEINKEKLRQQQMDEEERQGKRQRGKVPKGGLSVSAPMILEEDSEPMTMEDAIEELFGAVMTAMDPEGRLYSYDFRLLPSKLKYPEYYQLIDHPIDLKMVAQRIQAKQYKTVDDLEDDLAVLFINAGTFNEPGSRIFKDARTLRKLVQLRKGDLLQILNTKKSVRLRSKRCASNKPWSSLVAELEEGAKLPLPEEDNNGGTEMPLGTTHDDEESDEDVDPDNPQWQLFLAAKNLTVPSDPNYQLVEPFKRLPNRRWHADYYVEIKNPISMSQIRKKILKGEYRYISEMVEDFNLMFDNAQQYNRPDSRIYRDAIKLQKYVQNKAEEVQAIDDEDSDSFSDDDDSHSQSHSHGRKRVARHARPLTFKRRAKILFNTLMDYMTEDGRQPIVAFIEKPAKRDYPDYYEVTNQPIDMETIETKIKGERYNTEEELIADFRLMFHNCQRYNEEGSVIHSDATTLERVRPGEGEGVAWGEGEAWVGGGGLGREYYEEGSVIHTDATTLERVRPGEGEGLAWGEGEAWVGGGGGLGREYYEEGSVIHTDATTLERVLNEKIRELNQGNNSVVKPKPIKKAKLPVYAINAKHIKGMYSGVRDFRDSEGRQLSEVFVKLPSKTLYPDYYEVIKHPIDLERVLHKWKNAMYFSLDDMMADLTLMFQNACRYNEPDSQIYRDALTLQRHALEALLTLRLPPQKRLELCSQDDGVPNVTVLVQELFMSLFISVYNHEEEDGRYTAESFCELPDYDEVEGKKTRALSYDIMKRRLDKGLYARLDHFQEDLFSVFERARRCSKLDSRTYLDAITLQTEYMRIRDDLCNNGQTLKSKALAFTEMELSSQLETSRGQRQQDTEPEGEDEDSKPPPQPTDGTNNSSLSHNEVQYFVGDFVFLSPPDKNCEYPILHIERLWTNSEGRQMVYGCNYYRPAETFHLPSRKFFEQEVFKTEQHHAYPVTEVIGKCYILPLVDYVKMAPENVEEKDVFVCESRYNSRNRFFKKIKSFPFNIGDRVKLVERAEALEIKRVDSIFKERIERHKEELAELEEETKVIRRPLPNVARVQVDGASGNTYYEQYNISPGPVKIGDYVYVKGREPGKKSIRQISQLWVTPEGTAYFVGTVFKYASQTNPGGEALSYRQEVYLTAGVETLPVSDITGRGMVMDKKDYCAFRLTEIHESDVYVCESFLDEMNQRVSPLQTGLRKYKLSNLVNPDETYHFKKPININKCDPTVTAIKKQPLPYESSPLTPRMDLDFDDSMDGPPPSVASVDSGIITGTPKAIKKAPTGKQFQQMTGKKQMTGYILFSAEIRKTITLKNPQANFGEISRLVGIEWKRLTETDRKLYEDRAHQLNLESAERALSGNGPDSPQASQTPQQPSSQDLPLPNNPDVVFECMWESCDHMFEDLADLSDHLLLEATGHVFKVTQEFECRWRGCSRHKKSSLAPFPMVTRLARHVREVHIMKNTGRIIQHHDRSRNFSGSTRRSLLSLQNTGTSSSIYTTSSSQHALLQGLQARGITLPSGVVVKYPGMTTAGHHSLLAAGGINGSATPTKTLEPIFVAPPPKTQRLLHSEAYIKYIENLDKPFISNWEKHLMATHENTVINDSGRLPAQWLANGPGSHGTVVNALWALREYMMKDSLGIAKIL